MYFTVFTVSFFLSNPVLLWLFLFFSKWNIFFLKQIMAWHYCKKTNKKKKKNTKTQNHENKTLISACFEIKWPETGLPPNTCKINGILVFVFSPTWQINIMLVNHLHIRILNVSMQPLAFSSKRKHSLKHVWLLRVFHSVAHIVLWTRITYYTVLT